MHRVAITVSIVFRTVIPRARNVRKFCAAWIAIRFPPRSTIVSETRTSLPALHPLGQFVQYRALAGDDLAMRLGNREPRSAVGFRKLAHCAGARRPLQRKGVTA